MKVFVGIFSKTEINLAELNKFIESCILNGRDKMNWRPQHEAKRVTLTENMFKSGSK